MADMVKTTITVPEDLFQEIKLTAVAEKTTLSNIFREGAALRIGRKLGKTKLGKNPMRFAGILRGGIDKIYHKRSDLYDEHLRRKMGL